MQQDHLRLPADLRVYTDREDETTIFWALAVQILELLLPQALNNGGVDVAVGAGLGE